MKETEQLKKLMEALTNRNEPVTEVNTSDPREFGDQGEDGESAGQYDYHYKFMRDGDGVGVSIEAGGHPVIMLSQDDLARLVWEWNDTKKRLQ